jgi:hypothetical protein
VTTRRIHTEDLTGRRPTEPAVCLPFTCSFEAAGRQAVGVFKFERAAVLALLDRPDNAGRRRTGQALPQPSDAAPDMNKFAFSIGELVQLIPASRAQLFADIRCGRIRAVKWHRMTWVLRADLLDYLATLPACQVTAPTAPPAPASTVTPSTTPSCANAPQTPDKTSLPMRPRASFEAETIPSPAPRRSSRNRLAVANAAGADSATRGQRPPARQRGPANPRRRQ